MSNVKKWFVWGVILFFVLVLAILAWGYFKQYGIMGKSTTKNISGKVLDCTTGEAITDADITLTQSGFGIDQAPLYVYNATTNSNGEFAVSWQVGSSAHIQVKKAGYLLAEQDELPQQGVIIKLLKDTSPTSLKEKERTNYCTLSSECLTKSTDQNGTTVYRNICTHN